MKSKRNKNYKKLTFGGGNRLFSKIKCGNTKIKCSFYCLNNSKIKIAKEDFHQLTQCCDNALFMKKNCTQILKAKDLLEKHFVTTKGTKKVGKGYFSDFTAKNLIDPSYISSLLCFDIKNSWQR